MDDASAANLAWLKPDGLASDGLGLQQRKSAQTRIAILEAAIECLARYGYSRSTTQLIAQTADISRGAMIHHYATKQELIAAVIDYTFFKRLELFIGRIRGLTEVQRVQELAGVEIYWETLQTPEFTAYLELSMAARTDPELSEIFVPKAQRYAQVERAEVVQAFPDWLDKPKQFAVAMDFCVASVEGLLLNRDAWPEALRQKLLRDVIARTLLMIRDGRFDDVIKP